MAKPKHWQKSREPILISVSFPMSKIRTNLTERIWSDNFLSLSKGQHCHWPFLEFWINQVDGKIKWSSVFGLLANPFINHNHTHTQNQKLSHLLRIFHQAEWMLIVTSYPLWRLVTFGLINGKEKVTLWAGEKKQNRSFMGEYIYFR